MKLASMKLDPAEQKQEVLAMDKPLYPWGLSVTLDEEAIKKLGLKKLPEVGDELYLCANVTVTSVSANDSGNGQQRSLSLQLTDLGLGERPDDETDERDPADKLYGETK